MVPGLNYDNLTDGEDVETEKLIVGHPTKNENGLAEAGFGLTPLVIY
jgi:hypothetical protein